MAKRTRILYASESVWANGNVLYRVQTLGSNTTFTSEDVFELGHLDIVDVVDDVPAVAVTIDTNDYGSVDTGAILAGMNPARMSGAPSASGSYLRTDISCTGSGVRYYHGYALADYDDSQVKIWAPVQAEASLGTLDNTVEMTLFMDKVYVNSITLTYNVGANATENYAAETDNKMWLVNDGKFISHEDWTVYAPANSQELTLGITGSIPELSNCKMAFLSFDTDGEEGIMVRESTERYGTVYPIRDAAASGIFGYNDTTKVITLPTNAATLWPSTAKGYKFIAVYAASTYAASGGDATNTSATYFELIANNAQAYPDDVGAVRQGQVEIYLIDPDNIPADWDMLLRMQTVTITATPTRGPLNELGHLRPYARPMNFPVEVTSNTSATASDLELWAKFSGLTAADYEDGGAGTDLALSHIMAKENMILVIKIYEQTDEEAGGSAQNRKAMYLEAGDEYYDWDGYGTYANVGTCTDPDRERPLKTVIVPNLKITAENYNNAVGGGGGGAGGGSATQEFNFRSTNELYIVKGDVHLNDIACIERNTSADQF